MTSKKITPGWTNQDVVRALEGLLKMHGPNLGLVWPGWIEEAIARLSADHSAPETPPDLSKLYDAFSIGSAVRNTATLLVNIENSKRRSDCLTAIEQQFFSRNHVDEDGEEYFDTDLSWGAEPAEYVEQFRAAMAQKRSEETSAPQKCAIDKTCPLFCER